jgi:peptidyl-dipeptidase Dcp
VPLEDAGRHLDRLDALFGVMTSNLSTPEVQAVDKEWSPKVAATYDRHHLQRGAVPAHRRGLRRARVADPRAGAAGDPALPGGGALRRAARAADQAKLGAINEQLAGAFAEFSARVLADEDTWIVLDDEAQLAGLSPSQIAAYAAAAEERKLPGKWVVVNTRSSVDPFLTASARRDLRQRVWEAFKARGDHGDAHDTKALIAATSSGCAPSAPSCSASPPTPTGGWPTRWPSIRPRPTR